MQGIKEKEIKKLEGVKNMVKFDGKYFVTFDSVKHSDKAYEQLKKKKISCNKDVLVSVMTDEENTTLPEKIENNEKGIKVAVIDTGVNGASKMYDTTGEGVDDLNGHGTLVAELIQSTSDNKANIISIKAMNKDGKGSIASLYAAFNIAINEDVDVINLSATSGYKIEADYLVSAIKKATEKGITVVTSAGNYSADVCDFATAAIEEAVVVSAVEENGDFAAYSNYGKTVDYSAYGTYKDTKGTSIAAARVTGKIVKYGPDKMDDYGIDLGEKGYDIYYGHKTFDVNATSGEIPKDYFESIIFHADYKSMDDETFAAMIEDAKESMLSVWLKSLSDEDFEEVMSRNSILSNSHFSFDEEGNICDETTYAEYLLGFDIPDIETMAVIDKTKGWFSFAIRDYGSSSSFTDKCTARVHASVPSTADKAQTVTWSFTALGSDTGSMMNNIGFSATTKTTSVTSNSGYYSVLPFKFSYTKFAYRYAASIYSYADDTRAFYITTDIDSLGVRTANTTDSKELRCNVANLGMNTTSSGEYKHAMYILCLYKPKLNVAYNANGGTGAPGAQVGYYNDNVTLSSTQPTRKGYDFLGWSTSANATSANFKSGTAYAPTTLKSFTNGTKFTSQSVTLYAVWKKQVYECYFDLNGGSLGDSTEDAIAYITYGSKMFTTDEAGKISSNVNSMIPKREGCKFLGWGDIRAVGKYFNLNEDASSFLYIPQQMITGNTYLNMAGRENGKSGYWDDNGYIYGQDINMAAIYASKKGKIKFNKNDSGEGVKEESYLLNYNDETAKSVTIDISDYKTMEVYEANVTINFYEKGEYKSYMELDELWTEGWSSIDVSSCDTAKIILTTSWDSAINCRFYKDEIKSETVNSANISTVSASMFERDGYIFTGWNTEPDGTGVDYVEGSTLRFPDIDNDNAPTELMLYAQWTEASYYMTALFENMLFTPDPLKEPQKEIISEMIKYNHTVNINKTDDENVVVPGVTFEIECSDGSSETVTTDENGRASVTFSYDVSTEDLDFETRNTFMYCINFDELSETQKEEVRKESFISEEEAKAAAREYLSEYINSQELTYTIKEISHPDYVTSADDVTFTLKGDGAVKDVDIVDKLDIPVYELSNSCTLTPVFKVRKENSLKEPLSGVKINIYSDEAKSNLLVSGITDAKGEISYTGTPVTYTTDIYRYVDVAEYGQASERLKEYCRQHGYYSSYEEALEVYRKDKNYQIIAGIEEDYEAKGISMYASREKEMERTYYYQEMETIDGYVLDDCLKKVTVFWFTSDDIYQNILTNKDSSNTSSGETEDGSDDEELKDTFDEGYVDEGEERPVENEAADGEKVDYATVFINYQENVLDEVKATDTFTQKINVLKVGSLDNPLSGIRFNVTVNEEKTEYVTDGNGKFTITKTYNISSKDKYYYIKNNEYISDTERQEILNKNSETVHYYETKAEAEKAAKEELKKQYDRSYLISEIAAPEGYEKCDDVNVTLSHNEEKDVKIVNTNLGSIKIVKHDSKGNVVSDAHFGFYTTDTAYSSKESYTFKNDTYYLMAERATDKEGCIKVSDLKADENIKYLIIEKKTEGGMVLLTEPIEVGTLPMVSETAPGKDYEGTVVEKNGSYYYYDLKYMVTNDDIFELPKTGTNNAWWMLLGLPVIFMGAIFLQKKSSKKIS